MVDVLASFPPALVFVMSLSPTALEPSGRKFPWLWTGLLLLPSLSLSFLPGGRFVRQLGGCLVLLTLFLQDPHALGSSLDDSFP